MEERRDLFFSRKYLCLLVMLIDCMLAEWNYWLYRDFVWMVENENNYDNDLRMFVMEMYEVYVDVEKMDRVNAAAAAVVVAVEDDEFVVVFCIYMHRRTVIF